MDQNRLSRRRFIAGAGAAIGTAVTAGGITVAQDASKTSSKRTVPFSYCFNTSTILRQKLSLDKEIEITAKAGYDSIEPWVNKIHLSRAPFPFPAGLWTTMPSAPKPWNKANGTWRHWPKLAANESRHLQPVPPELQGLTL